MTELSRFWNGTTVGDAGSAPYDASTEFAQVLMEVSGASRLPDKGGVWRNELAGLEASVPGANTLRISAGRAQVYGTWYENDGNLDITIPSSIVVARYDVIVLRKDWTAQTVRLARHAGSEGSSWPTLTQSAGTTWEVPLFRIQVNVAGAVSIDQDVRAFIGEQPVGVSTNLLTNPGFEVWQRGATTPQVGPGAAGSITYCDRWYFNTSTGAFDVTKETAAVYRNSNSSMKVVTSSPPVSGAIQQYLKVSDGYGFLRGAMVSISLWARTTTPNAFRISVNDNVSGHQYSEYHPGDDLWHKLTARMYVDGTATRVEFSINFNWPLTVYIDNAVLVHGSVPAEFQQMHPADDLARCQRYYEIHGSGGNTAFPRISGYGLNDGQSYGQAFVCAVPKGGTPTVTKNGTWTVNNCGQPTVFASVPGSGYYLGAVVSANGRFDTYPDGADDTVTIEWNP